MIHPFKYEEHDMVNETENIRAVVEMKMEGKRP